ncbi:unnamed protein product [Brugia timori]|uniref:Calpain catalytic domain-containing protein n=1 Tax=Brugia timori TaxID=42155 RepID=A0A0R3RBS0_9BILA|nr:unnamed protein product [Brugia timori]
MGPNLHNFDLLRGKIDASMSWQKLGQIDGRSDKASPTRGACGSGRMLAD